MITMHDARCASLQDQLQRCRGGGGGGGQCLTDSTIKQDIAFAAQADPPALICMTIYNITIDGLQ